MLIIRLSKKSSKKILSWWISVLDKRQKAVSKKIFYNFLSNSNFGNEYRNNLDNCTFVPIFDELNEVTYHKIYYSLFDQKMSKYLSSDLMKQDTEEQNNDAVQWICKDDTFWEIKVVELHNRRKQSLEAAEAFDRINEKQKHKKVTDYWKRTEELMQYNQS